MSNMIGVKSGVDWTNIPSKYIAIDSEHIGDYGAPTIFCYMDSEGCSRWDRLTPDGVVYSEGSCSYNRDWGTDRYILKQDDLPQQEQGKEMEYKCLQDLPVGTFVKDGRGDISVWTGFNVVFFNRGTILAWGNCKDFSGFKHKKNVKCDLVSYSDKYNGEYKSLVPVKAPTPWKIKHLKSPTYTCGEDVALTILYRVVGTGVQYKYYICSKEDMFCKRTGIEVANNSAIYIYNPYSDCTPLQAALYSLTQQSVSRQVKKLINDFLNSK